jgi:2-desacetyl-2-hydroxyethyl bacteriochlorophyllide A dehydrogenase
MLFGTDRSDGVKAAVMHGVRDVRFEQIDKPQLTEEGEALLRVRACGICGSDLHTYREGLFPDLGAEVGNGRVLGHEFSGEIEQINGQIEGLSVGDRVVTVSIGANAEYLKLGRSAAPLILPVPDHLSFTEAATTEPLATSLHAANLADVQDDERVVIMGAGIIGLGVLQCIRARSTAQVTVINARHQDVVSTIVPGPGSDTLLKGMPGVVDVVFDCVGATAGFKGTTVLEQALSLVRQDGRIVVVAVFERSIEIDPNVIVRKGVRLIGSWAWLPQEFVDALELIGSAAIDRKPLISHEFALEDAAEAYATQDSAETAIKVMLVP